MNSKLTDSGCALLLFLNILGHFAESIEILDETCEK